MILHYHRHRRYHQIKSCHQLYFHQLQVQLINHQETYPLIHAIIKKKYSYINLSVSYLSVIPK